AQRFLEKRLTLHENEAAEGSVLEVKEEKGLGKTLDVILYDGMLRAGDAIAFSTTQGPKIGKVKALLKPKAMDEMRDPRQKFSSVPKVVAASGVKIACECADIALAGSSVYGVTDATKEAVTQKLAEEFNDVVFESEKEGAVLKADSLGSLEAIVKLFTQHHIPLKRAGIGKVSKNDVALAQAIGQNNKFMGVVFSFHQKTDEDILKLAQTDGVPVFQEGIIYNLLEGYTRWKDEEQAKAKKEAFSNLVLPAHIRVLPGHVFRVSGPCIVGVEVMEGRIRKGYPLIDGKGQNVGTVRAIQENKQAVQEAGKGKQLAVSIDGAVFGKNLEEKEDLYTDVSKDGAKLLEGKYASALSLGEAELLSRIKKIKGFIAFGQ
ncbi:MAG: translation initiation factor IF-2, partial [Candidatus Micrarchaeota archaeon]|nr:translation initiation factor IF-2 [Candidatus Micrarchaeota archaeon]